MRKILTPLSRKNISVLPMEHSVKAIARDFTVLSECSLEGVNYDVIFNEKGGVCAVIEATPVEREHNRWVNKIVSRLLVEKTNKDGCFIINRVWEDDSVPKSVLLIHMCEEIVANTGMTLLVYNIQFIEGKKHWADVIEFSKELDIFISDINEGKYFRYNGGSIDFNCTGINMSEFFDIQSDGRSNFPVFIMRAKQTIND